MIKISNTIKVNSSVSAVKIIDNNLYVLTSKYILNVYSLKNFSLLYKKLFMQSEYKRHIYDKSYSLSNDLHAYTSDYEQNNGSLFLIKDSRIYKKDTLSYHDRAVCKSQFSPDSKLLAVGDEGGKVFFYDLSIEKLLFSFAPRADAISDISFSQDSKYVFISSYDKSMIIYDILKHKELIQIYLSDVVEDSVYIEENLELIGITRDKKLFVYNIDSHETEYGNFEFEEWPSIIIEMGYKHLLVGTRGNSLYLINIESLEIIEEIFLDHVGVKTLNTDKKNLYISYVDGSVDVIDTLYFLTEFEANLKTNKFKEATSLLDENIFLLTNKSVKKYDEVWEQVLDIAKAHLINQNEEKALSMVEPFFFDVYKKEEYDFLSANRKDFERFHELVESEKIISAFVFSDDKEYLKHTKEYEKIENIWHKVHNTCKVLFEKNDLESSQKAIDTLKRYTVIPSKKKEVENLITNYKFFIRAHRLVKSKNFKLYFLLAEKKPFLTQDNLYKKVSQLGHQAYVKLVELEQNEEFDKAHSIATYLQNFTEVKEKANACLDLMEKKVELLENIIDDNPVAVYNSISNNSELESFKAYINYHQKFDNLKQNALLFAKEAKTKDVYNSLNKYFDVEYLINSLAIVFKLSYISEMENVAKEDFDSIHWIETIKRYQKIYGLDNEISSFTKEFELEQWLAVDNEKKDQKCFENIDFYDSILIYK